MGHGIRPGVGAGAARVDHGIVPGVVSADAGLRTGLVTIDDLGSEVAAVATWPHSSRASSMLRFADARRESVGESRCGVALAMAGIDVTPQVEIADERGTFVARVDFLVKGTKVVVEFDGKVKYATGDPEVLWNEKRRERPAPTPRLRGRAYHLGPAGAAGRRGGGGAGGPERAVTEPGRFAPEASPSHRNGSGAKVKLLASGEKVGGGVR